jgi:hypothetical protein
MNWAAEHELPLAQKVTHQVVQYVSQSKSEERCGNCRNYIRAAQGGAPRCRTVMGPIESTGWCLRYRAKETT